MANKRGLITCPFARGASKARGNASASGQLTLTFSSHGPVLLPHVLRSHSIDRFEAAGSCQVQQSSHSGATDPGGASPSRTHCRVAEGAPQVQMPGAYQLSHCLFGSVSGSNLHSRWDVQVSLRLYRRAHTTCTFSGQAYVRLEVSNLRHSSCLCSPH